MFDIGWSELLVIGVVLIVVVGPKDLPRMLRTFGKTTTQMRKMAGDFRKQFDEALREAEMDDVRQAAKDLRALDPTKDIRAAMNPMRAVGEEIRSSLMTATKAPEPKVPSATAPLAAVSAAAAEPVPPSPSPAAEPAPAEPTPAAAPPVAVAPQAQPQAAAPAASVIGTTDMQPTTRMSSNWGGTGTGAGARNDGAAASGETEGGEPK